MPDEAVTRAGRLDTVIDRLRGHGDRVGPAPAPLDQDIIDRLERHAAHEAEALAAYTELALGSPDEHVRYVAQLVLDDEVYHHQLLAEMLDRVRAEADWTSEEPAIPWMRPPYDRDALIDAIDGLIDEERLDLRLTASLRKRLRRRRDDSLLFIVVDILQMDTRKHIRILERLRRSARRR